MTLGSAAALAITIATAAAQQVAAPPQTPAPSEGGPAAASRQSALKLAGLVTFVANACPKLRTDYARFEAAINALGLTKADLDKPDTKASYLGYAARYNADVKTSCERAGAQFGPKGTTLSGIFLEP